MAANPAYYGTVKSQHNTEEGNGSFIRNFRTQGLQNLSHSLRREAALHCGASVSFVSRNYFYFGI